MLGRDKDPPGGYFVFPKAQKNQAISTKRPADQGRSGENMDRTDSKIDTRLAHRSSRPVLFEIISYRGEHFGPFKSLAEARAWALDKWPHQEQDEERTGEGWDIQVAGIR